MLSVDGKGFKPFWGPRDIKPLNFNYEFEPDFVGQNIWTLTDNLFVPERSRQDESRSQTKLIDEAYKKMRNVRKASRGTSKYKQYPTIKPDMQKSRSSARGSNFFEDFEIGSPPLSNEKSRKTSLKQIQTIRKTPNSKEKNQIKDTEILRCSTNREKSHSRCLFKGSEQPLAPTRTFPQKLRPQPSRQKKFQKSLNFKVRTALKPSQLKTRLQEKDKTKWQKPRLVKKFDPRKPTLENESLQMSSQMSSEKMSRSSGINELAEPLPKVKWSPTQESLKETKSTMSSLKKSCSGKSALSLSKSSKTSTTLKKRKNASSSQTNPTSREPSAEENTTSHQKIKTTKVRIIPKITLNNQLLKSKTVKPNCKTQNADRKSETKLLQTKKNGNVNSILWTPKNLALLDEITDDQQLKAALMNAGDNYLKAKTHSNNKSNANNKLPLKQSGLSMKTIPAKTVLMDKKILGNVDILKPVNEEKSATDTVDDNLALSRKPGNTRSVKRPETNLTKKVNQTSLLKTEGVPKTFKVPKTPSRKIGSPQLPSKTNDLGANKKRPKYAVNSRQVKKVQQRVAQLSGQLPRGTSKPQEIPRPNLDYLRKVIDKSLAEMKEEE